MSKLNFEQLVEALTADGFDVKVTLESGDIQYNFARFTGKGVRGGFCEYAPDCYVQLCERVAVDNEECFDKWSKCPLIMKLPVNFEALRQYLTHLGSAEGHEISSSYNYLQINPYPYELD